MVERFNFAETANERDEQEIQELMEQTRKCLDVSFNNIEYLLGNADFKGGEIDYQQFETIYEGLSKMSQALNEDQYDDMTRR